MASHPRAAQALLFMQQCRQHAKRQLLLRGTLNRSRSITDGSSLNPESFGKKLRFSPRPSTPMSEPRLNQDTPPTLQSYANAPPVEAVTETTPRASYEFPQARDFPIPRYRHNPAVKPGLWSFLKYRVLRMAEPPNPHLMVKPAFNVLTNPYRAKKLWPPVLAEMSEIQQFHYEKKFRRRLLNKTRAMRFDWDRWALFIRRFSIGFVLVYFALISDPSDPETRLPSDGLRYWIYGQMRRGNGQELSGEGAQFWPRRFGRWIESQYQYYKRKHKRQWDPYNHEGWDETRPRNSLPGVASPPVNQPLDDPSRPSPV